MRNPGVRRHVGEHRRAAQEAGVGGDEEQPGLERQHHQECRFGGPGAFPAQAPDDGAEGNRVERLPRHGLRVPQQVEQEDAARREGKRKRHVHHRELAGAHARLGKHVDVVRHGFQSGIGAAALRVGEQHQRGDMSPAELAREFARFPERFGHERRQDRGMRDDAVGDEQHVRHHEADENRQQYLDGLLHAAQVEKGERDDEHDLGGELVGLEAKRQQRVERVHAAGDGDRDREHVIEDERRAGGDPGMGPEQPGCDAIAAPAGGKQLDDLVVGERDDENRQRRGERKIQPEMRVLAQGAEGFLRSVAGGGDAVGTKADPGEKRHQRDVVARFLVQRVQRRPKKLVAQFGNGHQAGLRIRTLDGVDRNRREVARGWRWCRWSFKIGPRLDPNSGPAPSPGRPVDPIAYCKSAGRARAAS